MAPPHKQNGFAILIILIAVVILMLLYFVQIDTFFSPGLAPAPVGIEQHPWILEDLLVPEGQEIKRARSPKLTLEEPFTLTAPVSRNENNRGTVEISFEANGRILALWKCTYEQDGIDYQIDARMKGNIDVKRTFQDENGGDKSRLFFIARGGYTKAPVNEAVETGSEKGTCWLTGWICPDRTIEGHATITQNEKWAAAYTFSSP